MNLDALIASGSIDSYIQLFDKSDPLTPLAWLDETRFAWDAGTKTLNIDLATDGFGGSNTTKLPNGRYELRLTATAITDGVGHALMDDDGVLDGQLVLDRSTGAPAQDLFRFGGDLDGDGNVDFRIWARWRPTTATATAATPMATATPTCPTSACWPATIAVPTRLLCNFRIS